MSISWQSLALFLVVLILPAIAAVVIAFKSRADPADSLLARFHRSRTARIVYGSYLGLAFLFGTYALVGRGGSLLAHIAENIPMTCMFVASGILPGVRMRVGSRRVCAVCGYEQSPEMRDEPGADLCPECGARWRAPGGIAIGKMTTSRGMLIAGILLAAVPFAHFGISLARPAGTRKAAIAYLPTDSLIAEVTAAPRGFTMDEWTELSRRKLGPEQERVLAAGLVDLRKDRGHLDQTAQVWLDAHAASGGMEPALRGRYFRETIELQLKPDPASQPDGSQRIRLQSSDWRGSTAAGAVFGDFVLFGGFAIGGHATPQGRISTPIPGVNFASTSNPSGMPSVVVGPGEKVRVTCWVLIGPRNPSPGAVEWNEDGTPKVPAWAVYCERVELEWPARGE